MGRKAIYLACSLFLLLTVSARAQETDPLFFTLESGGRLPLLEGATILKPGPYADLSVDYFFPFLPWLSLRGTLKYNFLPLDSSAEDTVHTLGAGAGLGLRRPLFGKFHALAALTGGYYYALVTDPQVDPGRNLFAGAMAGIQFSFSPQFYLGLSADYSFFNEYHHSAGAAVAFTFRPVRSRPVEIREYRLDNVFPILLKHYDSNPLGQIHLVNSGTLPVEELEVRFLVNRYMDEPKICPAPDRLNAGQEVKIPLLALFSPAVLGITEDNTKAPAKVTISYTRQGKSYSQETVQTLTFYNRNAITWDDDRKAAAYITAKDPVVLEVSNNVITWSRAAVPAGLDKNLTAALAIHEMIRTFGITYVIDPLTPFEVISRENAVDYLKFPRQTLAYGAGDCDDLSILYSALLESIGIETAFITIPGHIYMAFALDRPPGEMKNQFLYPEDLIIEDNRAWIPLEITLTGEDFATAWETGARQWRQYQKTGENGFHRNHESWRTYSPIGFLEGSADITMPDRGVFAEKYGAALKRFTTREIGPRVQKLEDQIKQARNVARYRNRLGVLYARYGLLEEAREQFERIIQAGEYPPAMINLGNISFLEGDWGQARSWFERVYRLQPRNTKVLLQLSRIAYEQQDEEASENYYSQLSAEDPELARRFAFLKRSADQSSRAAEATKKREVVLWESE